jgi:hypothetical protein
MNGDDEPRGGGDVAVGDDGDDDERARHDDDVVGLHLALEVEVEEHCYHHMAVAVDAAAECVDDFPVAFPAQTLDAPYLVVAVDAAAECVDDPIAVPAQTLDAPYPCRDLYTLLVLGRFLYHDHDLSLFLFLVLFHAPSHLRASFSHRPILLLRLLYYPHYHGGIHSSTSHSASRHLHLHFHST